MDHRSYERQGLGVIASSISLASPQAAKLTHSAAPPFPAEPASLGFGWVPVLPTVHEGVAVCQMEAKGITTDKGDLNRWIRKANNILRDIRKNIAALTDWIKAIKEELSQPQAPTLAALLTSYYEGRNAVAWSHNARIGNLKDFAEAVNFLTEKGIATLEDLEAHIAVQGERAEAINTSMKAKRDRLNELKELLRLVDLYRDTKPIYDEWKGIKWRGEREDFERAHEGELRTFHMARRKLD